jgi:tRNA threonylcarbamoyladenosine biosynthesis protein TsaB
MILCLETSASICSVAIGMNGTSPVSLRESTVPNDHASMILRHIDDCLADAEIGLSELEGVAISQGPGSFTGLRVGVSAAKAICFAMDLPLIAVSTLAGLAHAAFGMDPDADYCIPMIEARKSEVYGAIFDRSLNIIYPEQVITLFPQWHRSILKEWSNVIFCGSGSQKYQEICAEEPLDVRMINTSATNILGPAWAKHIKKDYCVIRHFKPNYLKSPHITQPRKVL